MSIERRKRLILVCTVLISDLFRIYFLIYDIIEGVLVDHILLNTFWSGNLICNKVLKVLADEGMSWGRLWHTSWCSLLNREWKIEYILSYLIILNFGKKWWLMWLMLCFSLLRVDVVDDGGGVNFVAVFKLAEDIAH